jgi:hypothetical protein
MRSRYRHPMKVPVDVTLDDARRMPSFYRIARVNRPMHGCAECREHSRESWIDGSACDLHTLEEVQFVGSTEIARKDALLALKVLRVGGNPEPRFPEGSLGAAQFAYRRPAKKTDREARVAALTLLTTREAVAA